MAKRRWIKARADVFDYIEAFYNKTLRHCNWSLNWKRRKLDDTLRLKQFTTNISLLINAPS